MKVKHGYKPWTYKDPVREQAYRQRNHDISESLRQGLTFEEIGARYGISKQRVQQIARELGVPSPIKVRRDERERRLKAERKRLLKRPCFVCGKPAQSTRVSRRLERVYCEQCRALVNRDTNIKAAMQVRAASLILAARRTAICALCRRKLLGSNAYRGILCTRHDMALKASVHNAKQAMRNHPELDWQRILRAAAVCRQCGKRRASPGFTTCSRCRKQAQS